MLRLNVKKSWTNKLNVNDDPPVFSLHFFFDFFWCFQPISCGVIFVHIDLEDEKVSKLSPSLHHQFARIYTFHIVSHLVVSEWKCVCLKKHFDAQNKLWTNAIGIQTLRGVKETEPQTDSVDIFFYYLCNKNKNVWR